MNVSASSLFCAGAGSGGHYEPVSDSSNGELGLYLNPEERNSQDSCADMCASSFLTQKLKRPPAAKSPEIDAADVI